MRYTLRVRGALGERLASRFDGFEVTAANGLTNLSGDVVDQSQLYSVIWLCEDLGLDLIAVEPACD